MATLLIALLFGAADPVPLSTKDAFRPLNPLVGSWKGTGTPEGSREERQSGFWTESITWEWAFKESDTWFTGTIEKGKYFTKWDLRYLPAKDQFQLTATTTSKKTLVFTGSLATSKMSGPILTLDRTDPESQEDQRIVLSLLHNNRYLYRYDTKPTAVKTYSKKYQVGATKAGESFADVPKGTECIVSGGKGTIAVVHKGVTYYVCCSGCRDEFKADPEKYIKAAKKD